MSEYHLDVHTNGRTIYAITATEIGGFTKYSIQKRKNNSENWEYACYLEKWSFAEIKEEFNGLIKDLQLKPVQL